MSNKINILFVTSEAHPLIKTGGLADVSGALPAALYAQGQDVRLLIPGYPQILEQLVLKAALQSGPLYTPGGAVDLLIGEMPGSGLPVYVIDSQRLYQRDGGPYLDSQGKSGRITLCASPPSPLWRQNWPKQVSPLGWRPDIRPLQRLAERSCPAYLNYTSIAHARTLMTVHNLAYQGC